ncbi:hypothetical protein MUP05_08990, partial [Candidatus Bathyarchaeota archaeon]|nr:hypothetical protein [Candidatus Bathyarchaeota archaeon]
QVSVHFGTAGFLQGRRHPGLPVVLPELFDASAGHFLYQGQFSAAPPPKFLLDEPTDLPIVEFHPQKLSFIYEMISGYENCRAI